VQTVARAGRRVGPWTGWTAQPSALGMERRSTTPPMQSIFFL
jgi:hypothetical protein